MQTAQATRSVFRWCRRQIARQRLGLLLVLQFGLVYAVWSARGHVRPASLVVLNGVLLGCLLVLIGQRAAERATWFALVVGALLSVAIIYSDWHREPLRFPVLRNSLAVRALALYAVAFLVAGWLQRPRPLGRFLLALGIITFGVFLAFQLRRSPRPVIDVIPVCTEATQALLAGRNPYTEVYTNIYDQMGWTGYKYGHEYAMRYAYLPGLLLHLAVPVGLGADMRWLGLVAQVVGLALFASCVPLSGRAARAWPALAAAGAAVLIFWFHSGQAFLLEQGWAESIILLYLCLALWAWRRSEWLTAAALVLAFCSKQTAWFCGPFFLALAIREGRWRLIAAVAGGSVLLLAPFFFWDPGAFFRNVVVQLATLGPRPDALSWGAFYMRYAPDAVSWIAKLSYLLYALAFACLLARFRRKDVDRLMEAHKWMVLALFGLFLFSKVSFFNYYYVLAGLLAFYVVRCARGDYAVAGELADRPAAP